MKRATFNYTAAGLRKAHRRLERRSSNAARALAAMRNGATLVKYFQRGAPTWQVSNGSLVTSEVAAVVIAHHCVVGTGDCLFGDAGASQTYRWLNEERDLAMNDKNPELKLVESAVSEDPFDLTKLRVSQDFLESTNVKKLLTTVPVRRPGPQDFFRTHPSPKFRELLALCEIKEDRELFLVNLENVPELQQECFIATLFTAISRSGVIFLWPVRVPAADGRTNDWHTSAATAAEHAMKRWIRVKANMSLRAYEIFEAESAIPDPQWPDLSFDKIYRVAFRDRLVNSPDHPVIKRLRGG